MECIWWDKKNFTNGLVIIKRKNENVYYDNVSLIFMIYENLVAELVLVFSRAMLGHCIVYFRIGNLRRIRGIYPSVTAQGLLSSEYRMLELGLSIYRQIIVETYYMLAVRYIWHILMIILCIFVRGYDAYCYFSHIFFSILISFVSYGCKLYTFSKIGHWYFFLFFTYFVCYIFSN